MGRLGVQWFGAVCKVLEGLEGVPLHNRGGAGPALSGRGQGTRCGTVQCATSVYHGVPECTMTLATFLHAWEQCSLKVRLW